MKCKTCNKKMTEAITNTEFVFNNKNFKAINVPTYTCPICNQNIIPKMIIEKLQEYASVCDDSTIDYQKSSEYEATLFTVLHTFM